MGKNRLESSKKPRRKLATEVAKESRYLPPTRIAHSGQQKEKIKENSGLVKKIFIYVRRGTRGGSRIYL